MGVGAVAAEKNPAFRAAAVAMATATPANVPVDVQIRLRARPMSSSHVAMN